MPRMRPWGDAPSYSSTLPRPSHTLRAVPVASNSYQESDPVRGSRSRRFRIRQVPIRKSKSLRPSLGLSTRFSSPVATGPPASSVAPPAVVSAAAAARARLVLDIPLADDRGVVQDVARQDVGEGAHAEAV